MSELNSDSALEAQSASMGAGDRERHPLAMETLVSLCAARGFIYPASEIYGGIAGFWDYGPLGVELKNNLKAAWWNRMVRGRSDVEIAVSPYLKKCDRETLVRFHDLGVDQLIVPLFARDSDKLRKRAEELAAELSA